MSVAQRPAGEHRDVPDWTRLSFAPADRPVPALTALVEAFRREFTYGGAVAAQFTVAGTTAATWQWLETPRRGQDAWVDQLTSSSACRQALPEFVAGGANLDGAGDGRFFRSLPPSALEELIARHLHSGGAYPAQLEKAQAQGLAGAFVNETVGGRHDDSHVAWTAGPWTDWFDGVDIGGNATWIITDKVSCLVTLLGVKDTD